MKNLIQRLPIKICFRLCLCFFIIGGLSFFLANSAYAQTRNKLELSKPDLSHYPTVSAFFRAFDSDGNFVKNLRLENLRIQENDQVVAPDSLDLLEPGVRFIFAVNEGPTLANRYAAVSRIDKVKTALAAWAQAQSVTTMDDFSLISNTGAQVTTLSKPTDWVKAIAAYQPEMRQAQPGLASLSSAVDLATSASKTTQKTPTILYFTPLPTADQITGLKDIISRALQADVRLFIWLAGPPTYAALSEADLLRQAAEQTNGDFFVFSGAEELPVLSSYLDQLRYVYLLKYKSRIKTSGDYFVTLKVTQNDTVLESDPAPFSLKVLPPNPIFFSPPASVNRFWTDAQKRKDSVLTPDSISIRIMIEFPDGLKRNLEYSRLFIDKKLVDENTSPPFDTFEWDIQGIDTSGSHVMNVVIQDNAGFIAETVELPVEIVVEARPLTWYEKFFSAFTPQTIILFLVIAATGILLVSLAARDLKKNRSSMRIKSHRLEDPVTQPVVINGELMTPPSKSKHDEEWPHIPGIGLAPARMIRLSTEGTGLKYQAEIPLSHQEITIGSDSKKAKIVLNDPLVSACHAKISKEDQDHFKIFDMGSGAGTWLNYTPVSLYGARLQHGDLVQFGKIAFRFEVFGEQNKKMRVLPFQDEG